MCCGRNKAVSIVKGITYALLDINGDIAAERRAVCNACPFKKGPNCSKCGCIINAKIRVPHEQCPVKINGTRKWSKVSTQQ